MPRPFLLFSQDLCCTGRIRDSGVMCSETQGAPCIVENDGESCTALAKAVSNPILRIARYAAFMHSACACSAGYFAQSSADAAMCVNIPCQRDSQMLPVVSRTPARCDACSCCVEAVCSNGLTGVQNGDVCCETSCGTCGGGGCAKLPGGVVSWRLLSPRGAVCPQQAPRLYT